MSLPLSVALIAIYILLAGNCGFYFTARQQKGKKNTHQHEVCTRNNSPAWTALSEVVVVTSAHKSMLRFVWGDFKTFVRALKPAELLPGELAMLLLSINKVDSEGEREREG